MPDEVSDELIWGTLLPMSVGEWRYVEIVEHDSDVVFLGGEWPPDKLTFTRYPQPGAELCATHVHYAADDFEEIHKHIQELRKTEGYPRMCPQANGRLLYDCLRNSVKCSDQCPHQADWVGPNG